MSDLETGAEQIDIASLLAESETPVEPIPMGEAATPDTKQPQAPAETPEQAAERMLKINWRGTEKEVPESTVIRGYQQTYDLDQRFKQFKDEQTKWEEQKKEFANIEAKYRAIDEYATKNPEWFEHVQRAYEQAQQNGVIPEGADPADPMVQRTVELQAKLNDLMEWKSKVEMDRQRAEDMKAEQALTETISQVRQEFKDINFDAADENGITLENQIIKYGIDNGIADFRTASIVYLQPTLVKIAEERARKAAADEIVNARKAGIVSTGARPYKPPAANVDVRNMSYEDLTQKILSEIEGG